MSKIGEIKLTTDILVNIEELNYNVRMQSRAYEPSTLPSTLQ